VTASRADGLVWWSTAAATVGLIVVAGVVVDCPPYARRWAKGRDARELWRDGKRRGVDLHWLADDVDAGQGRASLIG
jgi:hypothetical protein